MGNKTRQVVVLNLGKLEGISAANRKLLGDRLEEIITGKSSLFSAAQYTEIEYLAQQFARKVAKDKIFPSSKGKSIAKDVKKDSQTIDIQTIEQLESKSIGAEWLVKQTFDKLNLPGLLNEIGLSGKQVISAQLLLMGKLIHPSSELEAQRWLNENSAAAELYDDPDDMTRYRLYQAASVFLLFDRPDTPSDS